jgi:hypothetical protein
MAALGGRSTLDGMEVLEHIGAIVIGLGAALVFALMAWAGSHQS